jgi:hypothetical protein
MATVKISEEIVRKMMTMLNFKDYDDQTYPKRRFNECQEEIKEEGWTMCETEGQVHFEKEVKE